MSISILSFLNDCDKLQQGLQRGRFYNISKRVLIRDEEDRLLFDDDLILGLLRGTRNYHELMKCNISFIFMRNI